MKSFFRAFAKRGGEWLCVLLAAVLVTTGLGVGSLGVYANAQERTFDIGVNPESITATLDAGGVLTVSGSGSIRDFTAETAPFAEYRVTELKLGADIDSIGSYTFYNCGGLTGVIELPAGLVRIGDGAFSGDSAALAPKPTFVRNPFTQARVTRRKDEAGSPESAPSGTDSVPGPEESSVPAEESFPSASSAVEEENALSSAGDGEKLDQGISSAANSETPLSESSTPVQEEGENKYVIETITRQEVGREIFYPCGDREALFSCSAENESFRAAMTGSGYREAEGVITAAFDCGEGASSAENPVLSELPVFDGKVLLPGVMAEFSPPEGSGLYSYTFGGWTESRDPANAVGEPGAAYPVGDKEDLFFIANWNRELLVRIAMERQNGLAVFTVPDIDGYELLSFRWQTCLPEPGEALPSGEELLPWEDIPGAQAQSYSYSVQESDDGSRLFRCLVTCRKKQNFLLALFSGRDEEELALAAVRLGQSKAKAGELLCLPGACSQDSSAVIEGGSALISASSQGYVTIPEPEECGFCCSGTENLVFDGWQGEDGTVYDPGTVVLLPENGLTLTARWETAHVVYVRQEEASGSGGEGTEKDPYRTLEDALNSTALQGDSVYTNIIVLRSDLACGAAIAPRIGAVTLTSCAPGESLTESFALTGGSFVLGGDVRLESITLREDSEKDAVSGLYAKGHKLLVGRNVNTEGSITVFGGSETEGETAGSPALILESGSFTGLSGGTARIHLSGSVKISGDVYGDAAVAGSAEIEGSIYGGEIKLLGPGPLVGGSLYGSGTDSPSDAGNISVEGFPNGLTLASIQRARRVSVIDSKLTLTGGTDRSQEPPAACSLAWVDELWVQNSTLCLLEELREVKSVSSRDTSGALTTAADPVNTLQAGPGQLIRIGYTDETGAAVYGNVQGVFWVELNRRTDQDAGIRIEAGLESDIGSGKAPDTGAFLRRETEANLAPSLTREVSYLDMVADTVPDSHNYWRLGSAVVNRTVKLTAAPTGTAEVVTVSGSIELPTSAASTVYKIASVQKTKGDFQLVLPTESEGAMTFTPTGSQTPDNTFVLRAAPTASGGVSGWKDLEANENEWGAYVLTALPEGQTQWNSQVEGVWKRGSTYPAVSGDGSSGEVTFTLGYYGSFENFSGGELELTFQETPGEGPEDDVKNTVVVTVVLEEEGKVFSQTAAVAPGKTFSECAGSEAEITSGGAVTASFLTRYIPTETGADHMVLSLQGAAFPAGTGLILRERSAVGRSKYYFGRMESEQSGIFLSSLQNCDGSGPYAGPAAVGTELEEDLLFVVDFSQTAAGDRLPAGSYSLTLSHGEDSTDAVARANFTVSEVSAASLALSSGSGTTETLWELNFQPYVSPLDTRYAGGICIRLTLAGADGSTVSFPDRVQVSGGAQDLLHDQDGVISFTLPAQEASTVALDFSGVEESVLANGRYTLSAYLSPRVGLQVPSDSGALLSSPVGSLTFALARTVEAKRSIGVSLNAGSSRLVDVSKESAQIGFTVQCENLQPGDRLDTVLQKKYDPSSPADSSYGDLGDMDAWGWITTGNNVALVVPKGTESGTYRVKFRLVTESGRVVAEEPYNFIVK